ncbi:hypothetical protein GUJ93_ZPchr0010g10258 [Zizania palustris]|uniref:Uncharacterized protein n=1 Tax=Zizania palustris TaxID=103762 RepID=A0A8J5WDF3_ZIZPA|nr:hypothetical protein GUJ93_ZPchr0010g10258 [Zizania palustris]
MGGAPDSQAPGGRRSENDDESMVEALAAEGMCVDCSSAVLAGGIRRELFGLLIAMLFMQQAIKVGVGCSNPFSVIALLG